MVQAVFDFQSKQARCNSALRAQLIVKRMSLFQYFKTGQPSRS
jgi:hypothetical protein